MFHLPTGVGGIPCLFMSYSISACRPVMEINELFSDDTVIAEMSRLTVIVKYFTVERLIRTANWNKFTKSVALTAYRNVHCEMKIANTDVTKHV